MWGERERDLRTPQARCLQKIETKNCQQTERQCLKWCETGQISGLHWKVPQMWHHLPHLPQRLDCIAKVSHPDWAPAISDANFSQKCSIVPIMEAESQPWEDIYTCKVQTESVAEKIAPIATNNEVKTII